MQVVSPTHARLGPVGTVPVVEAPAEDIRGRSLRGVGERRAPKTPGPPRTQPRGPHSGCGALAGNGGIFSQDTVNSGAPVAPLVRPADRRGLDVELPGVESSRTGFARPSGVVAATCFGTSFCLVGVVQEKGAGASHRFALSGIRLRSLGLCPPEGGPAGGLGRVIDQPPRPRWKLWGPMRMAVRRGWPGFRASGRRGAPGRCWCGGGRSRWCRTRGDP